MKQRTKKKNAVKKALGSTGIFYGVQAKRRIIAGHEKRRSYGCPLRVSTVHRMPPSWAKSVISVDMGESSGPQTAHFFLRSDRSARRRKIFFCGRGQPANIFFLPPRSGCIFFFFLRTPTWKWEVAALSCKRSHRSLVFAYSVSG